MKKRINKLPQVTFIERKTDIKFAEGYVPFAEKIADAKEALSICNFQKGSSQNRLFSIIYENT